MKKFFLSLIFFSFITGVNAQTEEIHKPSKKEQRRERINAMAKQEEEGVITYTKHFVAGGKLTNDGYGGFLEMGRAQSINKGLLFQLEITERKHPKEEKQQIPFTNSSPFIYGKINFFYPVKLGVQQQFLLGNKGNKNGVSVTGNLGGGLVLGLLRPYMMDVDIQGTRTSVKYESEDSVYFLNGPFYGGPGLGKGWGDMKITPGIYIKPALRFDYGKYNEMVNAIEVGLTGEFYSKKIPQMVYNKQQNFFLNAFVAIVFGRRK